MDKKNLYWILAAIVLIILIIIWAINVKNEQSNAYSISINAESITSCQINKAG